MDKEDKTRLERLLAIEDRISSNKFPTMAALCEEFDVKPRTIYADIRLLRERFGIDIRFDRFRNGYFNANPGKRIPIGDLADDDYVLLMVGISLLGSSMGDRMRAAIDNITGAVGKRLSFVPELTASTQQMFVHKHQSNGIDPHTVVMLGKALMQDRAVRVNVEGASEHTLVPICFAKNSCEWHVVGTEPGSSELQQYPVAKITKCELDEHAPEIDRQRLLDEFNAQRKTAQATG